MTIDQPWYMNYNDGRKIDKKNGPLAKKNSCSKEEYMTNVLNSYPKGNFGWNTFYIGNIYTVSEIDLKEKNHELLVALQEIINQDYQELDNYFFHSDETEAEWLDFSKKRIQKIEKNQIYVKNELLSRPEFACLKKHILEHFNTQLRMIKLFIEYFE